MSYDYHSLANIPIHAHLQHQLAQPYSLPRTQLDLLQSLPCLLVRLFFQAKQGHMQYLSLIFYLQQFVELTDCSPQFLRSDVLHLKSHEIPKYLHAFEEEHDGQLNEPVPYHPSNLPCEILAFPRRQREGTRQSQMQQIQGLEWWQYLLYVLIVRLVREWIIHGQRHKRGAKTLHLISKYRQKLSLRIYSMPEKQEAVWQVLRPLGVNEESHLGLGKRVFNGGKPHRVYERRMQTSKFPERRQHTECPAAANSPFDYYSIDAFLQRLYASKIRDLQTTPNYRQEQKFIDKMNKFVTEQQFNTPECEFGAQSIRCICELLPHTRISVLVLDKNPLGFEGVSALSQIIPSLSLRHLSLASVNMNSKACKILLTAVVGLESLKLLNISSTDGLSKNKAGKEGIGPILDVFSHPKCGLVDLNVSNVCLSEEGFEMICRNIAATTTLRVFSCRSNCLRFKQFRRFISAVVDLKLQLIDFSQNKFGNNCLKLLGDTLGTDYGKSALSLHLRSLNLACNGIQSYEIETFCRDLSNNNILQELILDGNPLSEGDRFFNFKYYISRSWSMRRLSFRGALNSEDIHSLCQGLQSNRTLSSLDLSKNKLNADSFSSLCQLLSTSKSLKVVVLDTCKISDPLIIKCESLLAAFKHLETFRLDNNFITEKGGIAIKNALLKNRFIHAVSLQNNCINSSIQEDIKCILRQNKILRLSDSPDLLFFHEMQSLQKEQQRRLISSIGNLKMQERKLKFDRLLTEVADRQVEEITKKKIIAEEKTNITQLQSELAKHKYRKTVTEMFYVT